MDASEKEQRIHNAHCYNTYMWRILNQKKPITDYQIDTLKQYANEARLCLKPLVEN